MDFTHSYIYIYIYILASQVIETMSECDNTITLGLLSGDFPHDMAAVAAQTPEKLGQ